MNSTLTLYVSALIVSAGLHAATVTAYCACSKCCGSWSKAGKTSAGTIPRAGRTAAGPRNIKLGTRIYIDGIGIRIVEDRTARRYDGTWEVFITDHEVARRFGRRNLKVTILSK